VKHLNQKLAVEGDHFRTIREAIFDYVEKFGYVVFLPTISCCQLIFVVNLRDFLPNLDSSFCSLFFDLFDRA